MAGVLHTSKAPKWPHSAEVCASGSHASVSAHATLDGRHQSDLGAPRDRFGNSVRVGLVPAAGPPTAHPQAAPAALAATQQPTQQAQRQIAFLQDQGVYGIARPGHVGPSFGAQSTV
jgi:hypothetical protein